MSQFLFCGCCWCNCGVNLGVYCSGICCSFWLIEPQSMVEFDPEGLHCLDRTTQGIGCNFLCPGFEMCASQAIVSWSKKLNSPEKEEKPQKVSSRKVDDLSNHALSRTEEWKKASSSRGDQGPCSICLSSSPDFELGCGHSFHRECIMSWAGRNKACPVCRSEDIMKGRLFCGICKQNYCDTALNMSKGFQKGKLSRCTSCLSQV